MLFLLEVDSLLTLLSEPWCQAPESAFVLCFVSLKIWESCTSGVENPHTCDGGCSLVAEDSETEASGCLWAFEGPGAAVAQGLGDLCVNICARAGGAPRAWNNACFFK